MFRRAAPAGKIVACNERLLRVESNQYAARYLAAKALDGATGKGGGVSASRRVRRSSDGHHFAQSRELENQDQIAHKAFEFTCKTTNFRCQSVSHCFDWPLTRGARSLCGHAPFWSGRAGPPGRRAAADFAAAGAAISQRSRSPSLRIQPLLNSRHRRRQQDNRRRKRPKQPPARTSRGSGQGKALSPR